MPRVETSSARPRICSVEGCEREHKGHGYCNTHYQRFKRHGDPLHTVRRGNYPGYSGPKKACSVEGCEERHLAKGYCPRHYQRFRRHGDPEYVPERSHGGGIITFGGKSWSTKPRWKGVTCKWPMGCEKEAKIFGLCTGHAQVAKFDGRYEELVPPEHRRPRCRYESCQEPSYSNEHGYCRLHLLKFKRGTLDRERRLRAEEMEEPGNLNVIGGRIKNERIKQGLTQGQLAKLANVNIVTIVHIERGKTSPIVSTLEKLADALGIEVADFFPKAQPELWSGAVRISAAAGTTTTLRGRTDGRDGRDA
jgi:DNA-binding XRE family transcriptional regulator